MSTDTYSYNNQVQSGVARALQVIPHSLYGRVTTAAAVSIAGDGTYTKVTFGSTPQELDDAYGMWDTTDNRWTVPYDAIYLINFGGEWESNSSGLRKVGIEPSIGRGHYVQQFSGITSVIAQNVSAILRMAANDYIEAKVGQTSGKTLTFGGNASNTSWFEIVYLGPTP